MLAPIPLAPNLCAAGQRPPTGGALPGRLPAGRALVSLGRQIPERTSNRLPLLPPALQPPFLEVRGMLSGWLLLKEMCSAHFKIMMSKVLSPLFRITEYFHERLSEHRARPKRITSFRVPPIEGEFGPPLHWPPIHCSHCFIYSASLRYSRPPDSL